MPDSAERDVPGGPRTVPKLLATIERFRALDPEMQAQSMIVFLHVALREGMPLGDLVPLTGLASSSVSRNVAALSHVNRRGAPGHGLIEATVDRRDRRVRRLSLSPKGRAFLRALLDEMAG